MYSSSYRGDPLVSDTTHRQNDPAVGGGLFSGGGIFGSGGSGFLNWNTPRDPNRTTYVDKLGGWVSGWGTDAKQGLISAGGQAVGGWIGGRQAAKAAEATGRLQQEVAMAELAQRAESAAAMRRMVGFLALLGVGAFVAVKVSQRK